MNLLALATLTTIIKIEFCALYSICNHLVNISRFHNAFSKLKAYIQMFYIEHFGLCGYYVSCLNNCKIDPIAKDEYFDFELPCASVFVLAYCVVHNETNYFQEFAHKQQAIQHCDSKGLGYEVLCKYASCDCNNTWFDDIVHHASITVYMTLGNMLNVVSSLPIRHSIDWHDATMLNNLISDIQEGYLSINHKSNKLYKVTVQTKLAYWYSTDKPDTMPPSLSMLVVNVLSQFEIACIEMLVFYMGMVWDRYDYDWLDCEYIADAIFNYRHDRYKHFGFNVHIYDEYFDSPIFALTD